MTWTPRESFPSFSADCRGTARVGTKCEASDGTARLIFVLGPRSTSAVGPIRNNECARVEVLAGACKPRPRSWRRHRERTAEVFAGVQAPPAPG